MNDALYRYYVIDRTHRDLRVACEENLGEQYKSMGLSPEERMIRPDESATPTADCLMQNPTTTDKIFKLRNRFGNKGVCAVFNINAENKPVSGTLSPMEIGIADGDYAYYNISPRKSVSSSKEIICTFRF